MNAPSRSSLAAAPENSATHRLAPWVLGFLAYWITYAGAFQLAQPGSTWSLALRGAALTLWPEMALAPVVVTLVRRLPWDPSRLRVVALLLAGAVAFVALSLAGMVVSFSVEGRVTRGTWELPESWSVLVWRGVMTLVAYCALCGIAYAVAFSRRVRDEAARAARAETLRVEARLAALRAQLQPHFILNLLHSLVGMVERDPPTAAAALERLGGLLRHALRVQRQDGEVVPLRDELQLVDDYLALERLRLGDRLRVTVDVDASALVEPVPAFVLQPLVENAVRHAVAPRAQGGTIAVTVRASDGTLRLRVEDDGATGGELGGAQLAHQRDDSASPVLANGTRGEGLGLRLIQERLAALYGKAASLRAGNAPGTGFTAEVVIPRGGAEVEEER